MFLKGIAAKFGLKDLALASVEDADFDVIARHTHDGCVNYVPIQIKEYRKWNSRSPSLESELKKLSKYADSVDLEIAYLISGKERIDFKDTLI